MSGFLIGRREAPTRKSRLGGGASLADDRGMALHRYRPVLASVLSIAVLAVPAVASADDPPPPPPPPADYPPPPPMYPPPPPQQGGYVAPLAQQTQPSYVPQSVALSGPRQIVPESEWDAPPPGYTPIMRKRKGALIGGTITFGVSYGISLLLAAAGSDEARFDDRENEFASMWVPVAGPFLQILETESATGSLFLAGLGAAQAIGAGLMFYGMTSPRRVFVRNDLVGRFAVTPMAGKHTAGIALSGQF